jgi:hypothetical protein
MDRHGGVAMLLAVKKLPSKVVDASLTALERNCALF